MRQETDYVSRFLTSIGRVDCIC